MNPTETCVTDAQNIRTWKLFCLPNYSHDEKTMLFQNTHALRTECGKLMYSNAHFQSIYSIYLFLLCVVFGLFGVLGVFVRFVTTLSSQKLKIFSVRYLSIPVKFIVLQIHNIKYLWCFFYLWTDYSFFESINFTNFVEFLK